MENPKDIELEETDYNSGADGLGQQKLHISARFHLSRDRGFYGPGTDKLLHLTEETGSLLEACRRMELSYSKGRRLISLAEQQLGFALLSRQQGGKSGGHSSVTEDGKTLMRSYNAFCEEAHQYLDELFQKYF